MRRGTPDPIRFGCFEVDRFSGELRRSGMRVRLSRQSSTLLLFLLESPGQVRTREEIRQRLWTNTVFVEFDHSLNKAVHTLRSALGDAAHNPRFVETVAGQGYRFLPVVHAPPTPIGPGGCPPRGCSLAVLPFVSDPADPELCIIADQLPAAVTDEISGESAFTVMPYGEVRRMCSPDSSAQERGRKLGVRTVISGELTCWGGDLHAHVAAVRVVDGSQFWGARFHGGRQNLLTSCESLALDIALRLRQVLGATNPATVTEALSHA